MVLMHKMQSSQQIQKSVVQNRRQMLMMITNANMKNASNRFKPEMLEVLIVMFAVKFVTNFPKSFDATAQTIDHQQLHRKTERVLEHKLLSTILHQLITKNADKQNY